MQTWLDNPAGNYGVILNLGVSNKDRYPNVAFHSSEADTLALRPLLTIDATVPIPEPSTIALLAGVICGIATLAIRRNRSID